MILIDMEMPKTCEECKISRHSELSICPILNTYSTKHSEKRLDNCPIKGELPKGHGRLIDRDALRESMHGACMGVMAGSDDYDTPLKTLDSAPTVIEADKEIDNECND